MSEFLDIISPKALEELKKANAEIVTMVSNVKKVNENLIGAKTPSGSDGALKALTTEYQKQEQAIAKMQKQLEKARLDEIRLQQAREKAFDKYEAQLTKEQAKLQASENLYNKVQAKLNALSVEYKALATRKELGIALTDKEAQRYTFLQGKIQTYDKALKAVDATMGKHQRNVGNYASGFNPLTNSINQLTREMPAFTYSVQTGFMALSNNIPIFTDAISNAIAQNKALQAEGKPTTSVLKQLAGAFFSWQTLMGVGITLLTVYGKEIGEWFNNTMRAGNATKYLAEATKDLKDAQTEALKSIAKEKIELQTLLAIARDETKSKEQRLLAVEKLQKQYPEYFGNLSKEKILAGETAKAEQALTDALLQRARAQAVLGKITENEIEIIDLLDKEREQVLALNEAIKEEKRVKELLKNEIGAEAVSLRKQAEDRRKYADEQRNQTIQEIDDRRRRSEFLSRTVQKDTVLTNENTKAIDENTKGKAKNNKEQEKERELIVGSVEWLEKEISILKEKQSQLSTTSEEYQAFNTEIQTLIGSLEILTNKAKETEKAVKDMGVSISDFDLSEEGIRKWTNEVGGYIPEMAKDWKDSFQEWSGVALDAIQTVQDAQTRQFENQLSQLEQSKRIAILFAGESASAREEIERQYDEKRRAILTRQARQEKAYAIVNSLINTATAVVKALPNVPLSVAVGIIGAAQTALIASQQIPQFYKGTDNAPEGWAWTQEKGAEIITDKSGKVKSLGSNKGAQLTHLNKGDKVFTAEQSKNIMFNKELNSILSNNGILDSRTVVNNNLDLSPLRSDIRSLEETIKNKSEIQMITDRQGERVYRKEASKRALLVSNRLRIKS